MIRIMPIAVFSGILALSSVCVKPTLAQGTRQAPSLPTARPATLSTADKVKAEFAFWRYAGARIGSSFQRGPLTLLTVTTTDDMEKVWKFYMGRVPNENKVPLSYSWEIPGDNTMMGANYKLGSSFVISLNSAPREAGTIVYQKGTENTVIEVRARTADQIKDTGIHTDIKLIKIRPLRPGTPEKGANTSNSEGNVPATIW